jgi:hypothetical protein
MPDYFEEYVEKITGGYTYENGVRKEFKKDEHYVQHLETLLAERDAKLTAIREALMDENDASIPCCPDAEREDVLIHNWYKAGMQEQRTRIENILNKECK